MQELKQKNKKITEERQKILGINDYFSASLHFLTFLFQCKNRVVYDSAGSHV